MTRKRNKKRKKSSESDLDIRKSAKHGGQDNGISLCEDSEDSGDLGESQSEHLSVSQLLKSTNYVLYNDSLNATTESVSVFESSGVVSNGQNMASTGSPSSNVVGTQLGNEPSNADIMSFLVQMDTRFTTKISSIESRLKNLEGLEAKLTAVDNDVKKLWVFMQDSQKKNEERINRVEEKQDSINLSVGLTSDKVTQLEKERVELKNDLVYLQSQSMRNNLLFSGLPEAPNETPEQTERSLREFMVEKLQMAQQLVDDIAFERVHRMGPRIQGRPRKIVAKFTRFKDREAVRKLRSKLNNTDFYINEQFPKEVVEKRKSLMPRLRAAKRENKSAWLVYDKLYIDGKVVNDSD